jgi:hypothetical protein
VVRVAFCWRSELSRGSLNTDGAPDGNAAERPTVRVAVVGASEVAVMPLSPPPPQALSAPSEGGATAYSSTGSPATGGNSGRPLDEFLKTWIRQNIGADTTTTRQSLTWPR